MENIDGVLKITDMSNYRKLDIWEDSCKFAKDIYQETHHWSDFALRDQLRRSAISIASNIAEGSDRGSDKEFIRFLHIAKASAEECRTQLYIAFLVGLLSENSFNALDHKAASITKRIGALIKYLKST